MMTISQWHFTVITQHNSVFSGYPFASLVCRPTEKVSEVSFCTPADSDTAVSQTWALNFKLGFIILYFFPYCFCFPTVNDKGSFEKPRHA
ncbi:hypothetical protein cypCar_00038099 [Cyprinus carpio]|nr:hypothetical protein cypCar_00038099 [Cyprinus carpio]